MNLTPKHGDLMDRGSGHIFQPEFTNNSLNLCGKHGRDWNSFRCCANTFCSTRMFNSSRGISMLGYKSQLEDLKSTVDTVHNVLVDAAASDELTHTARNYIEKLRTAVYDTDDLFDEFRTLAERKQLLKDCKLPEKVSLFFSSENSYKVAYKMAHKMAHEIKRIRKNLDDIARNHKYFGFSAFNKRIRNRREETSEYVNERNIIGRDADVKAIVDKLLNLNGEKGAHFLTVVGFAGMGKTALAQLVCADQRVKEGFRRSWWVCVGDEDNTPFDKKTILSNILDLATGFKHHNLSLEELQKELREQLEGKKYLLVLDDVWSEDKVKWAALKDFLMLGAVESRVLVTTRSNNVANAIGNSDIHVLEGLSVDNSWRLFEMAAFEGKLDSPENPRKVEIGKKIVEQCSNVPLAINVVGSLLCDEGLDKWQSFERSGLGGIRMGDNHIMTILKFSYHNLEPSLKNCFTYCALFPKDYVIKKDTLIKLWMAQGYIVPFDRGQSIKEASEEHFKILLRRNFFQDVIIDEHGKVESFKMHDLMHDVAQEVAGHEIFIATSETSNLRANARHVYDDPKFRRGNSDNNVKVRSYLREFESRYWGKYPLDAIFKNGGCLRTLAVVNNGIKIVPHSIGDLLHLRYLDFSHNSSLKKLPDLVTKLHNLQTLKLEDCISLEELPTKFSRLVNLMQMNIKGCDHLKYMPVGMHKMTSLCELSTFVVADESSSRENRVGQLKDLRVLAVNLKDRINIFMRDSSRMDCLKSLPASLLSDITLRYARDNNLDELVKVLDNRSSLRSLAFMNCSGQMINLPGAVGHLSTLEYLRISWCRDWRLEGNDDGMAWRHFSHNLRSLILESNDIKNLPKGMQYLTSLEELTIEWFENLEVLPEWINYLSSLHSLSVYFCLKLKSIPEAMRQTTSLKRFKLLGCSEELKGRCQELDGEDWPKIKHIPDIKI